MTTHDLSRWRHSHAFDPADRSTRVADGPSRKSTYDASFTREGKLVSPQRVAVNLDV
jgi:hypothetical protein